MTPGRAAYEEHAKNLLHIPRADIRPLTWEELGQLNDRDHHAEWEAVAQAVLDSLIKPTIDTIALALANWHRLSHKHEIAASIDEVGSAGDWRAKAAYVMTYLRPPPC